MRRVAYVSRGASEAIQGRDHGAARLDRGGLRLARLQAQTTRNADGTALELVCRGVGLRPVGGMMAQKWDCDCTIRAWDARTRTAEIVPTAS